MSDIHQRPDDMPDEMDLRIESEEADMGIRQVTITAYTLQARIDLATEFPRIKKLLERDWAVEQQD